MTPCPPLRNASSYQQDIEEDVRLELEQTRQSEETDLKVLLSANALSGTEGAVGFNAGFFGVFFCCVVERAAGLSWSFIFVVPRNPHMPLIVGVR